MLRFIKNFFVVFLDLILLLSILLTATFIFLVEARLKEIVNQRFDGFYNLEYSSMSSNINPFSLNVTLHDAHIRFDTLNLKQTRKLPCINFKAKEMKLSRIGTWSIILQRDIKIGNISFEDPELEYFLVKTKQEKAEAKKENEEEQFINDKLNRDFLVKNIQISKGKLDIYNLKSPKDPVFKSAEVEIGFKNLRVLKRQSSDLSFIQYEQALVITKKSSYTPIDSDYYYNLDSLYLDKSSNLISISGIDALCRQSLTEHSKDYEVRKMFAESKIKTLIAKGVDFQRLMEYGQIKIAHMYADSAVVNMLQNFQKHHNYKKVKPTLREMVGLIDIPLIIDTLSLKRVKLVYNIFSSHQEPLSTIFFTNIKGKMMHINSIEGNTDTLNIDLRGGFLRSGGISFKSKMPLSDTTNNYTYSGTITHLDFKDFNNFLNGFIPINLKEGTIDRIVFSGTANKSETWGRLNMFYSDLKFEVINPDSGKKSGLKTLIAKIFIRKNNNESTDNSNSANFHHVKPHYKGQVVLWLGGILDGMKEVMLSQMATGAVGKAIDKKL